MNLIVVVFVFFGGVEVSKIIDNRGSQKETSPPNPHVEGSMATASENGGSSKCEKGPMSSHVPNFGSNFSCSLFLAYWFQYFLYQKHPKTVFKNASP